VNQDVARIRAEFDRIEARRLCREAPPGAVFRRHLFWRYTVVWTKVA